MTAPASTAPNVITPVLHALAQEGERVSPVQAQATEPSTPTAVSATWATTIAVHRLVLPATIPVNQQHAQVQLQLDARPAIQQRIGLFWVIIPVDAWMGTMNSGLIMRCVRLVSTLA